jgi:hypothetical protein
MLNCIFNHMDDEQRFSEWISTPMQGLSACDGADARKNADLVLAIYDRLVAERRQKVVP